MSLPENITKVVRYLTDSSIKLQWRIISVAVVLTSLILIEGWLGISDAWVFSTKASQLSSMQALINDTALDINVRKQIIDDMHYLSKKKSPRQSFFAWRSDMFSSHPHNSINKNIDGKIINDVSDIWVFISSFAVYFLILSNNVPDVIRDIYKTDKPNRVKLRISITIVSACFVFLAIVSFLINLIPSFLDSTNVGKSLSNFVYQVLSIFILTFIFNKSLSKDTVNTN